MAMTNIKVVVVGDGGCGKTSLLIRFTENRFPSDYVPTVFDNFSTGYEDPLSKSFINLSLWDTAGQEEYSRLRCLSYPETDIFLICFSLVNPTSLENVLTRWVPEVRHMCPDTPIILLGLKSDLTEESRGSETGEEIAVRVHAAGYLEVSSLFGRNVKEAFDMAIKVVLGTLGHSHIKGKRKDKAPPELPKNSKAPMTQILSGEIAENLGSLLGEMKAFPNLEDALKRDPSADVIFYVQGEYLTSHRIVLCSSSSFFRSLLLSTDAQSALNNPRGREVEEKHPPVNEVIEMVRFFKDSISRKDIVLVTFSPKFLSKTEILRNLLEFLYTGGCSKIESHYQRNRLLFEQIRVAASTFRLSELTQICDNLPEMSSLNPSIGTWLNDRTAEETKRYFLFNDILSDLTFKISRSPLLTKKEKNEKENGRVEISLKAHKSLLLCRCPALLEQEEEEEGEVEVQSELEAFKDLLEYLYTDHCPALEEGKTALSVLILADRFKVPRLITLCELYVTRFIELKTTSSIETSDCNIVSILELAELHNAPQLAAFCRHFLASNYTQIVNRPEFSALSKKNREYVERNRWPPVSYFTALEEWQKENPKAAKKLEDSITKSASSSPSSFSSSSSKSARKDEKCLLM